MREAYPLGRAAALKALELDETLAEAHNSLAAISFDYYWDWAAADRHFARAIDLGPNYQTALEFYSSYLACMARHEEALGFATRARNLDPVSPRAWNNLAVVHYFARRYDEAARALTDTLELDPNFGPARIMLGRVYDATGMPERAVEQLERAQRIMGVRPDVLTPQPTSSARLDAGPRRSSAWTYCGDSRSRRIQPRFA
jgi:tetratricopeptide (TPR) repeat protein